MLFMAVLFLLPCALSFAAPRDQRFVKISSIRRMIAGRNVPDLAVADRLLVGVDTSTRQVSTAAASVSRFGGQVSRSLGRGRVLVVDLPPGSDIVQAAEKLRNQPGIAFAEPDRAVYTTLIPDDPQYVNQPHLPKIRCPEGWDIGTGGADVTIAIIDSGIDSDHPDIAGRLWSNLGEIPGNGLDDDQNGFVDDVRGWNFYNNNNNIEAIPDGIDQNNDGTPDEQVNHGTLTAGLAAASANGFGTVGVNWHATIMALKVFTDDGTTAVSTVVDAMFYAVDNGADIMNLSIGTAYTESFTPPIAQLWQRGGLTVSSGGNEYSQITDSQSSWWSPSCNNGPNPLVDNMNLGVGGLTLQDRKASWSNYDASTLGNFVEVFAPGVNVFGPGVYYPSVPGFSSYYTSKSGTSFAAPLVTGLAAMLKSQDPSRTGAALIQLIRSTCDSVDAQNPGYVGKLGAGRINVARAMGAELPVQPPTNVQAFDTGSDQGGSITVVWTKSIDDGSGANSVLSYKVQRAEGALPAQVDSAGAGWLDVGTVQAGSILLKDDTTNDGIAYYYRVAAVAANSTTWSEPAGPAYSYDDAAPPRVDTLTAMDLPFDNGQAIVLDWSGHLGGPDLNGFKVYRQTSPFNSVLGLTPLATLANANSRTYVDTPTVDGVDYYYAVTGTDAFNNERMDVIAVGPVQSFVNGPVTFAAGVHMLGTQAVPVDQHPATLFGIAPASLRYARYNPATQQYVTYSDNPIPDFLKLELGRGFWVAFSQPVTFSPAGATVPAGNFGVQLQPGWQQIGNPYFGAMDFNQSTVTVNGNTMDLESADTLNIMRSYAWTYNTGTGDYGLLHPLLGQTTMAPAWAGMWVLADQACTLTMARPVLTAAAVSRARPAAISAKGEWPLQIVATGSSSVDAANYCGVSSAPDGIQAPPRPNGGVDLYFVGTAGQRDARYATDFETGERVQMNWDFNVTWDAPQDQVSITWPDLSRVPHDYSLTLVDKDTGRRSSMKHQTGYTITASAQTGVRHFAIEASKSTSGVVQISSVAAQQAGSGAQIVFTMSAAASCSIEVMNIAGRRVRAVETERLRSAGTNTAAWNGVNDAGSKVPAGRYLFRITARSDDGVMTSALRSVHIQR